MMGALIVVFVMIVILSLIMNDGISGKRKQQAERKEIPPHVRKQYPKLSARVEKKTRKEEEKSS